MQTINKNAYGMRWVSNIHDPTQADAWMHVCRMSNQTQKEAWQQQQEWLSDKYIGEPKATEYYTVDQLCEMRMVGVYVYDDESLPEHIQQEIDRHNEELHEDIEAEYEQEERFTVDGGGLCDCVENLLTPFDSV